MSRSIPQISSFRPSLPRRLGCLPLVAPTWIVLGGLFLLPLAIIFLVSFATSDGVGGYRGLESFGSFWQHVRAGDAFDNYARTFRPQTLRVLWRSVWIAVVTTILCIAISYPVAYYLAVRASPRIKHLLLVLTLVPFWTSFLIRTYAWMAILRPEGLINLALQALGLTTAPLQLLYNDLSVAIGLVYGELPFMILPLYASLEKLDRTLLEASADLGAGSWSTFRRVTLPLSAPGLMAGTVLVFIPSLGQFIVPHLLGGTSIMIGNVVQDQFAGTHGIGNRPFGAALAFQLTALVFLLVGAYAWWARRRGNDELI